MKIKVGIIGAGMVARGHLLSLSTLKEVELSFLCDVKKENALKLKKEFSIPQVFTSYEEALEKEEKVNLIYILTPHKYHLPIALKAFSLGKDVVCEKPLARNYEEAKRILEEAKKKKRRLFVAENHRYLPQVRLAKKIIEEGGIGKPFLSLSTFCGDEWERMNDPLSWKGTPEESGGGVLVDNGPHMIDTLLHLFGKVKYVLGKGEKLLLHQKKKAEDTFLLLLFFEKKILSDLSLTFSARFSGWPRNYVGASIRYDLFGSEGSLHWRNEDTFLWVRKGERKEFPPQELEKYTLSMTRDFIESLKNRKEPLVKPEEALEVMKVISAGYLSSREKRQVFLKEIEKRAQNLEGERR